MAVCGNTIPFLLLYFPSFTKWLVELQIMHELYDISSIRKAISKPCFVIQVPWTFKYRPFYVRMQDTKWLQCQCFRVNVCVCVCVCVFMCACMSSFTLACEDKLEGKLELFFLTGIPRSFYWQSDLAMQDRAWSVFGVRRGVSHRDALVMLYLRNLYRWFAEIQVQSFFCSLNITSTKPNP